MRLRKEVYGEKEEKRKVYEGLRKKVRLEGMIGGDGLEVSYEKRVDIVFGGCVK